MHTGRGRRQHAGRFVGAAPVHPVAWHGPPNVGVSEGAAEVRGERRLNRPRRLQSSAAGSDRIPGDPVGRAMQPD